MQGVYFADDGKEVDGVPTEGVEITWFNMDGAHYMINTPSDPLLFVAVKEWLAKRYHGGKRRGRGSSLVGLFQSLKNGRFSDDEEGIILLSTGQKWDVAIADDELLDDPAIISAIDEETEFNALVEEEAALLDSLIGKR
ncbi:hypothetical protein K1719_017937 [Acacia pycnantha]|nr:hypothetical protein K1719_017937 [Acacia pycnantha]